MSTVQTVEPPKSWNLKFWITFKIISPRIDVHWLYIETALPNLQVIVISENIANII